jgi:hypothetical protein
MCEEFNCLYKMFRSYEKGLQGSCYCGFQFQTEKELPGGYFRAQGDFISTIGADNEIAGSANSNRPVIPG